jgi:hypothetical protein
MILNVPNAFVKILVPKTQEKTAIKIREALLDRLLEMYPQVFNDYVNIKRNSNQEVLYVYMLMTLYRLLTASFFTLKNYLLH